MPWRTTPWAASMTAAASWRSTLTMAAGYRGVGPCSQPMPVAARAPAPGPIDGGWYPVPTLRRHDRSRAPVRPLFRGLRDRRHLQALAGQDDHGGGGPPLLHDHDEPPSAAHQRVV